MQAAIIILQNIPYFNIYFTSLSIKEKIILVFTSEKLWERHWSKQIVFHNIDAIIPLPLFASKEKKRGYNQAKVLCDGMSSVMNIPVFNNAINRVSATETQTRKNRIERWENISGKFEVQDKKLLQDKHVLLVDDVVTTGATLDACANELLKVEGLLVSIATLAFTMS